jgi:hypothetical protein
LLVGIGYGIIATEIEMKTGMTDAECAHWDNYYTKNAFEPGRNLLKQGVKPLRNEEPRSKLRGMDPGLLISDLAPV